MPSSDVAFWTNASVNQIPVTCNYGGGLRLICPIAVGKAYSIDKILAYQVSGYSSRGLKPLGSTDNWRCLRMELATAAVLTPGAWYDPSPHSQPAD